MVMVLHPCRGSFCNSLNLNDYNPSQCSMVEGNPYDSCKELAELDANIVRTYALFVNFAQKRRTVKEKINRHHDPLIQHLPVEIISRVFRHCVKYTNPRFLERDPPQFSKTECSASLILAAVCRNWREIAFATPRLWTTANIFMYSIQKIPLQEELTREWFGRSGKLGLEISILQPKCLPVDYTALSLLFNAIRDNASRWQQLALRMSPCYYPTFIGDLTCVPLLENLRLFTLRELASEVFSMPETPALAAVSMKNTYLVDLAVEWTNITVLQMTRVSIDEIFELLRRADKLEKCIFDEIHGDGSSYPLPTTPVTHPSVKDLKLAPVNPHGHDFIFFTRPPRIAKLGPFCLWQLWFT